MPWRAISVGVTSILLAGLFSWSSFSRAADSRFAMTYSRSQYVHWIDLYDAEGNRIDPTDPNAAPYSPVHTCGKCHDYDAVTHGYHFNAMSPVGARGRPGEPWIWTDTRTGTQIPLSYRGWPGTYDPRALGITGWDMVLKFGHHMPGGGPGTPAGADQESEEVSARDTEQEAATEQENETADVAAPPDNGRWSLSGELAIDCMMCHGNNGVYSHERWWDEITKENFAWAPAAALGIADIDGEVARIRDVEPSTESEGDEGTEPAGPELPSTSYRFVRMDGDNKIFFDVVRQPSNNACYYCHTTRVVGEGALPDWTHDEDVHLRAGMSCADCHRNGIEHHTVRGYEGEEHPTGQPVATLSCRGCHLGDDGEEAKIVGGRLGAPKPLHKGLPPLHLESLSCTACHSGPGPRDQVPQVQTAMAHVLGLPTHDLNDTSAPQMVAPVMLRTNDVLYPHRMVWPAFWGEITGDVIKPLHPEVAREAVRRKIRVRRNDTFTDVMSDVKLTAEDKTEALGAGRADVAEDELTAEEQDKLKALEVSKKQDFFREKLGEALVDLKEAITTQGAEPVYVGGGRAYRLGAEDKVEVFDNPAAEPYAWKLAHDVRPARWSSGAANGCYDCHKMGAPIFDGKVAALGPGIDADPPTERMLELAGYDRVKMDAWNKSFQGRTVFKWFGFASAAVVAVILLSFLFLGVNGVLGVFRRS